MQAEARQPALSGRELAVVLGALRYMQQSAHWELANLFPEIFEDCPDGVSSDEIDDLCEKLNSGDV